MTKKSERGTSLIEALVALGVAVVIIAGMTSAVITALSNSGYSKTQTQATAYAQEGMEAVKQLADTNYAGFKESYDSVNYCMGSDLKLVAKPPNGCSAPGPQGEDLKLNNLFLREVTIQPNNSDCRVPTPTPTPAGNTNNSRIIVKVLWTDSRCKDTNNLYCHKVQVDSCVVDSVTIPTEFLIR